MPGARWVPPHGQHQLQAGPEQGADCFLVRGLPHVLPVHCWDAVPTRRPLRASQARGSTCGPGAMGRARPLHPERPRGLLYLGDEQRAPGRQVAGVVN